MVRGAGLGGWEQYQWAGWSISGRGVVPVGGVEYQWEGWSTSGRGYEFQTMTT